MEHRPVDESHVHNVANHLLAALQAARDPNLKESLSTALAAIHKHMAAFQKEREQALQGKLSPRLLAEAQGQNPRLMPGDVVVPPDQQTMPGPNGLPIPRPLFNPGGPMIPAGPIQGHPGPVVAHFLHAGPASQFGPAAQALRAGDLPGAVQLWEQHHPAAMMGRAATPAWVSNYLASLVGSHVPNPAASAAGVAAALTNSPAPGLAVS